MVHIQALLSNITDGYDAIQTRPTYGNYLDNLEPTVTAFKALPTPPSAALTAVSDGIGADINTAKAVSIGVPPKLA